MKKLLTLLAFAFCLNGWAQCAITVNSPSICAGATTTLTASGATTYTWSANAGSVTTATVLVSPSVTTIYTVTGTTGTCTAVTTITLMVNPLPITNFISDSFGCSPLIVSFTNLSTISSGFITSYYWAFGNGNNSGAQFPSLQGFSDSSSTQVKTYTVTLKAISNTGCSDSIKKTITVYPIPNASFTPNLLTGCSPQCINFMDASSGAQTYTVTYIPAYSWNFGDILDPADFSNSPNPVHCYTVAGTYTVMESIINSFGCKDSTSAIITVTTCAGISQISGLNSNISIYPNPNNGSFVIEPQNTLYNVHCTVYDVNGKAVLSQTINSKTSIDASSLNEGVYNISLQSSEGVLNKRVVIVR